MAGIENLKLWVAVAAVVLHGPSSSEMTPSRRQSGSQLPFTSDFVCGRSNAPRHAVKCR